jgi:hypothetical protein
MTQAHKFPGRPMTRVRRQAQTVTKFEEQDSLKTLAMFRIEQRLNAPIQELLADGTGKQVASKIGITESGVCRWRKRFGMKVDFGHGAKA